MKILLLNENPVVNKLVTLSAQKTSDELEVVGGIDDVSESECDLLVVDDTVYTPELFDEIQSKVQFSKSLYICSRNAQEDDRFTRVIKKPFLPTDLVELFSVLGKDIQKEEQVEELSPLAEEEMDELVLPDIDEGGAIEDMNLEDDLDLDLDLDLDDTLEEDVQEPASLDLEDEDGIDPGHDIEGLDDFDDLDLDDDLNLDDLGDLDESEEISLDDEMAVDDSEEELESVLDKDELQEVQNLLSEAEEESTETDELDLSDDEDIEDELNLDEMAPPDEEDDIESLVGAIPEDLQAEMDEREKSEEAVDDSEDFDFDLDDLDISEDDLDPEQEVEFEEAPSVEEKEEMEEEELSSDLLESLEDKHADFDNELVLEDELNAQDDLDDLSLEEQIESAVSELTEEELESELDEDTLLGLVSDEIDEMDNLNTRDLQLAIGEEVSEEEEAQDAVDELEEIEEVLEESSSDEVAELTQESDDGVESLKRLLEALSDKNIAASMKGMKITINIELGDK